MIFPRLSIMLALALCCSSAAAGQIWRYDMLLERDIIGEQTLRLLPNQAGAVLIQTTEVKKEGWFSDFIMRGLSAEQLSSDGRSIAMQTHINANGRSWWSQLSKAENGLRGSGHDMGIISTQQQQEFDHIQRELLSESPPTLADIKTRAELIFGDDSGERQATLKAETRFVTSLNALPFYLLKHLDRMPGALQLLDNEGMQVINSPITDLGSQQMEIGGQHYSARHIKIEKADAGTHIWFNQGDTGPVLLMIAGKSGKKKFQISLKENQGSKD